jgi:hypothetical protein
MVKGITTSLTIDIGFVLEGQQPQELPESLLGACRSGGGACSTWQPWLQRLPHGISVCAAGAWRGGRLGRAWRPACRCRFKRIDLATAVPLDTSQEDRGPPDSSSSHSSSSAATRSRRW